MTGVFISARLGSTRLEQKHLIEVAGRPFIEWLTDRLSHQFSREINNNQLRIYITTSEKTENSKFEDLFAGTNVEVFYGSDNNIPLRHLQCAQHSGIDSIISIDGDDILCSTVAARLVFDALHDGKEYVQTSGLPLGMNVTGYRTDFLESSLADVSNTVLETGWGKIFNPESLTSINIASYENLPPLRMTLDYKEDAAFFEVVISALKDDIVEMPDMQLVQAITENEWFKLNIGLNNIYWENFNQQKQKEN